MIDTFPVNGKSKPRSHRKRNLRPALLRGPDAARYCAVSTATWHRLVSAGRAPAPIRLGGADWLRE